MDFPRTLEMSVSREEFFRFLSAALGAYETDGRVARGTTDGHPWTVALIPLPGQLLGSALMPRHRIEITIDRCTDAEGAAFLERFHRAFLRGGG
jgi:hypothetical protein